MSKPKLSTKKKLEKQLKILDTAFIGNQTLRKECVKCSKQTDKVKFYLFKFAPSRNYDYYYIAALCKSKCYQKYYNLYWDEIQKTIELSTRDVFYLQITRDLLT